MIGILSQVPLGNGTHDSTRVAWAAHADLDDVVKRCKKKHTHAHAPKHTHKHKHKQRHRRAGVCFQVTTCLNTFRMMAVDGNLLDMTNGAEVGPIMREFNHGRVYRESPLFTRHSVTSGGVSYCHGDDVVCTYNGNVSLFKIVGIFIKDGVWQCTALRYEKCQRGTEEVELIWGVEHIINPSSFKGPQHVTMVHSKDEAPATGLYCKYARMGASEAVCAPGTKRKRTLLKISIDTLPKMLYEGIASEVLERIQEAAADVNTPLLRLFFIYFYDDFAPWTKRMGSIGGGYLTFGNLPRHLRNMLRNIVPIHFGPHGVPQRLISLPFEKQLKRYEECKVEMTVGGQQRRVRCCGGIGCALFDLPQGNAVARVKQCSASTPCRRCMRDKQHLTGDRTTADIMSLRRDEDALRYREQIEQAPTKAEGEAIAARTGTVMEPQLLDTVRLDRRRQIPFEKLHQDIIGNSTTAILRTVETFKKTALGALNERLKSIHLPATWTKGTIGTMTPATDFDSFPGNPAQSVKIWMQVLHGVLCDWLEFKHFRSKWGLWLAKRCGGEKEAVAAVLDVIATHAHLNSVVFAEQTSSDWGSVEADVTSAVDKRKAAMNKLWANIDVGDEQTLRKAPAGLKSVDLQLNQHGPDHHHEDALDFVAINTSAARFETKHGAVRGFLTSSNGQFPEINMMVKASVTAIFYICATSATQVFNFLGPGVHKWMLTDPIFRDILCTAQEKAKTYAEGENHEYSVFSDTVQCGPVTHTTEVGGHIASVVSHFELCDREIYARNVQPGCWYFTSKSDQSAVVRVVQCVLVDDRPLVQVECYKRNEKVSLMHGCYPVLISVHTKYVHVSSIVRPAMTWHHCTPTCRAKAFSQCTRTTGSFILNPFFLK